MWPDKQTKGGCLHVADGLTAHFVLHPALRDREEGESLERYIKRLASGEITHEEVHEDFGHGAHVLNPITEIEKVIVSGPKRELIEKTNLDWHHAAPGGDVMMTGTIGLIKTILG